MNLDNILINEALVPPNYLQLARQAQKSVAVATKELIEKRKLPENGFSDVNIEMIVRHLSQLDSNNFVHRAGLGEREARIVCGLVARRHYNFGHGIGRSGDLLEPQPKAAGSTLLANLTNSLLLDLIHAVGIHSCSSCFLLPMATGMSLTLCFLSLRKIKPDACYILWSRIDQKSCFKSITTAGFIPIIIEPLVDANGYSLTTNIDKFEQEILRIGVEHIVCIYATTSCFAPRNCDNIIDLSKLAAQYKLPHIVNNAYGLQSTFLTHQLEQTQRLGGRIDLFVQSTDKNLLVPVGGAIIAGFDDVAVRNVAKTYAGRSSSSQTLDVFMTLMSLGKSGYLQMIKQRKENFLYLRGKLQAFALTHNELVIETKQNPISLAITLEGLQRVQHGKGLTHFGSMLYSRGVSGTRVVAIDDEHKAIDGHEFKNWGHHHQSGRKVSYLTVAASIGITVQEIDTFFEKLNDCWTKYLNKQQTGANIK